jgi:hypothetical protein
MRASFDLNPAFYATSRDFPTGMAMKLAMLATHIGKTFRGAAKRQFGSKATPQRKKRQF